MADTFDTDKNTAFVAAIRSDFEITRRVGGSKTADLSSEPRSESDRALSESRHLLDRLRRAVPE